MKKILLGIIILMGMIFIGCSEKELEDTHLLEKDWEKIVEDSHQKKVNLYMWGGSDYVNQYIDGWVSPSVKEKYDIILNRVPVNHPKDMINKLLTEKEVNKRQGSMDLIWINGENFKWAKQKGLLWDSFAKKLPRYNQYIDPIAKDIKYDFSEDTEGMEVPFGKSHFVFIYDSDKIKVPPKSIEELKEWIKAHPGKFTYPAPPDFTGSAFIRQALIELNQGDSLKLSRETFGKVTDPLWRFLNDIKPKLWREGKTYPESSAKLDQLYASGEVWMSMSYNPVHAYNKVQRGQFRPSTKTFIMKKGTLSNTHYLSIPFNGKEKGAAMVVIDFLLSPCAQMKKLDPTCWGDGTVLSLDKLSSKEKELLKKIDRGSNSLPLEVLEKNKLREMSSEYIQKIDEGFIKNVIQR